MISHITLGTKNIKKAVLFYETLLGLFGGKLIHQSEKVVFFNFPNSDTKLAISIPFDGMPATHGNGTMVAFKLLSIEKVKEVYCKAIELGASCEGAPGERNEGAFFGAYFRDFDGNKIAVFYRYE